MLIDESRQGSEHRLICTALQLDTTAAGFDQEVTDEFVVKVH